ncbi:MAG TPA: hypothetical protein VK674_02465 [Candidatus Limnocylindria bacterium]|nr:hypothetical protein [Candidatus Limnocylindria bacterium]
MQKLTRGSDGRLILPDDLPQQVKQFSAHVIDLVRLNTTPTLAAVPVAVEYQTKSFTMEPDVYHTDVDTIAIHRSDGPQAEIAFARAVATPDKPCGTLHSSDPTMEAEPATTIPALNPIIARTVTQTLNDSVLLFNYDEWHAAPPMGQWQVEGTRGFMALRAYSSLEDNASLLATFVESIQSQVANTTTI